MFINRGLAINGRFLAQPLSGVQRYGLELLTALDELFTAGELDQRGWQLTVFSPTDIVRVPAWKTLRLNRVGPLSGHLWEQLVLPAHARKMPLITLASLGPLFLSPAVTVVQDIGFITRPQGYSSTSQFVYRTIIPALAKRARIVIVPSEFTKAELVSVLQLSVDRIRVIHHGVDHILRTTATADVLSKYGLTRPFVLAVASTNPNKNIDAILYAASSLQKSGLEFVMVGSSNSRVYAKSDRPLTGLRYLGQVSDADLRGLYTSAVCLVFPSLYEGFGMPPLEAMACGCPVICSNAASLPEVCGSAALMIDPKDYESLCRAIERMASEPSIRAEYREKGLNHVKAFSWKNSARKTWELIEEILPS